MSSDAETAFVGFGDVQPPEETVMYNSVADNEAGANEGVDSVATLSSSTPVQGMPLGPTASHKDLQANVPRRHLR